MTTVIQPSIGAPCIFTQGGVGTTPGYSALDARRADFGPLQEGVYGTPQTGTMGGVAGIANGDFLVSQRGVGANMSVDINMPAGGFAFVQGDTLPNGQGLYTVPVHNNNINEAIATADPTNPRVDIVIVEIFDNVIDGSGLNTSRTRVVTGTPTPGATLTNRSGAPALPGSALLLADVLVPATATSIPNSGIRDRRKWARGAFIRQAKTASASTTSASLTAIDTATLQCRVECSGVPIRLALFACSQNTTAADSVAIGCNVDGSAVDSTGTSGLAQANGTVTSLCAYDYVTTPSAGSHLFTPTFEVIGGGTATLLGAFTPITFVVEELVRSNTQNNNGVTTG